MERDTPVLLIEDVVAGYGDMTVLRNVSLAIARNEGVAVVGPNGAGKSTLVRTICGLVETRSGAILKGAHRIDRLAAHLRPEFGIAVVLENRNLFGELPMRTNLDLAARTGARRRSTRRFDIPAILDLFPFMKERLDAAVGLLSGGEQQMVAIARALLLQPDLLVLDEPSTGLAPKIVKSLAKTMGAIRAAGVSILLVEQNVALAVETTDRAYVMNLGRITKTISPEDWRQAADGRLLAQAYLGT